MKNSRIKYKTSTDFNKLKNLLDAGITIIGFIALNIDNAISDSHSKLVQMRLEDDVYYLGEYVIFKDDVSFNKFCEDNKVKFIDL